MEEYYSRRGVNLCQIGIGVAGLLVGTLVYLIDRPPRLTYFIYKSGFDISLYQSLPNLFGFIGGSLPSFLHVFSFILITAGVISYKRKGYLIICLGWFLVDCIFELGQKYNSLIWKIIPDWFLYVPFLENSKNYFVHGTFDIMDLVAVLTGSLSGYFVLTLTMEKLEI